ncbi:hypothetical protein SNEBB_003865 [Seison nebaliae]|nr:hypothetical protein SNEBB_003865 [Seison nebaliae]
MRLRRKSRTDLDNWREIIEKTVLCDQDVVTGLLSSKSYKGHAWIRDNVYGVMSVWVLSIVYKKATSVDYDRAAIYELEHSVIRLMRGLLTAMMRQKDKVEIFKNTLSPKDSIHAKYSSKSGETIVGDDEWGHLQIDAVSLYLLILAQMTASGLRIIYTIDEVTFIQNLVYYIENAYMIPDYGIWERGDKTNHGLVEMNASSIGMAKAALESLNGLDLFGAQGGSQSIIYVLQDHIQQCDIILKSMLPRCSNSKETDASLLSIISFPAFAISDNSIIELTKTTIETKLHGTYGLKRFLRDGYKTPLEDSKRLFYLQDELKKFEDIECEWPLFYCYLLLDALFMQDDENIEKYSELLERVLIQSDDSYYFVPELYAVPLESVEKERQSPHSQPRIPDGQKPHIWAQSLYIVSALLREGYISTGEMDPLNRRHARTNRLPKQDLVIQISLLTQDTFLKEKLRQYNINIPALHENSFTSNSGKKISVLPGSSISKVLRNLGKNEVLNLSGRPIIPFSSALATSKIFFLGNDIFVFTPEFLSERSFYMASDTDLLVDMFTSHLSYLNANWINVPGRPLVVLLLTNSTILGRNGEVHPTVIQLIRKLKTGFINECRVQLAGLDGFLNTSCLINMKFLRRCSYEMDDNRNERKRKKKYSLEEYLEILRYSYHLSYNYCIRYDSDPHRNNATSTPTKNRRKSTISGIIRRSHLFNRSMTLEDGLPVTLSQHVNMNNNHNYENVTNEELIEILENHDSNLYEQADVLYYLTNEYGLSHEVNLHGSSTTVDQLITLLYNKATANHKWWLVRYCAGLLDKRVDELVLAITSLIVRQKQLSIGLGDDETAITEPIPPNELDKILKMCYVKDVAMRMLTQELIFYLSMFISTEEQLFLGIVRFRIGLVIQLMIEELQRIFNCDESYAMDNLLSLSPFELKTFLRLILNGQEFGYQSLKRPTTKSNKKDLDNVKQTMENKNNELDILRQEFMNVEKRSCIQLPSNETKSSGEIMRLGLEESADRQGQWIRRRKLDGSLNRVPCGFYEQVWELLQRSGGIIIKGHRMTRELTNEMTKSEIKFALAVADILNKIQSPVYRQFIVEALTLLTHLFISFDKHDDERFFELDTIVREGNRIFVAEQLKASVDKSNHICCANDNSEFHCKKIEGMCRHFCDSAPSGRYGTISFLLKASAPYLGIEKGSDCKIQ